MKEENPYQYLMSLKDTSGSEKYEIADSFGLDKNQLDLEYSIAEEIQKLISTEKSILVPRDTRIDDSDMGLAKNIYDWITSDRFMGNTSFQPFLEQLTWCVMLLGQFCPRCSDVDWLYYDHNVNDTYETFEKKVCMLENGVCPSCGGTRSEFVKKENLFFYNELAVCVAGNTYVNTNKGLFRIKDLEGIDLKVQSEIGFNNKVKWFFNGERTVHGVTTESGYYLETTEDHQYLVVNENNEKVWKQLKHIKENDRIFISCSTLKTYHSTDLSLSQNINNVVKPEKLTLELSELLGIAYTTGEMYRNCFVFNLDSQTLAYNVCTLIKKVFDITTKPVPVKDRNSETHRLSYEIILQGINGWLRQLGLEENSDIRCVDKLLMSANYNNTSAFLNGIHKSSSSFGLGVVKSNSLNFLRDIQILLLTKGVFSYIKEDKLYAKTKNMFNYIDEVVDIKENTESKIVNVLESIVSVENKGVKKVYDIEVEKEHCLSANGVIIHNCAGQRCVSGDTEILTSEGIRKIQDIVLENNGGLLQQGEWDCDVDLFIFDKDIEDFVETPVKATKVFITDPEPLISVYTKKGYKLKGRSVHPILVIADNDQGYTWKMLRDLSITDELVICDKNEAFHDIIINILYCGAEYTFDFHVPEYHCFIGNGFVNHNSGKSLTVGGILAPYIAHQIIKTQKPTQIYNVASPTMLHGTFSALTYVQAKDTLWEFFYGTMLEARWFQDYFKLLDYYEEKYNTKLYKLKDTFMSVMCRNLTFYPAGPDTRILRGRCVVGSTIVNTNSGFLCIEELTKGKGQKAVTGSLNVDTYEGMKNVSHIYEGKDKTIKLKTENGFTLEGTYEHPMLVLQSDGEYKWVRLDSINIDDYIVSLTAENNPSFGNRLDGKKEISMCIGILCNAVQFNDIGESIYNKLIELARIISNDNSLKVADYKNGSIEIDPDKIYQLFKHRVDTKVIIEHRKFRKFPKEIMSATKESMISFIHAYFESHPYFDLSDFKKELKIRLYLLNKDYAEKLHVLLFHAFGILGKLKKANNAICTHKFTHEKHVMDSNEWCLSFEGDNSIALYDIFVVLKDTETKVQTGSYVGVCKKFKNLSIKALIDNGAHYERVVSLKCKSKREVYDLTVPDNKSFTANCLTSHNTRVFACITGDQLISTDKGLVLMSEIEEGNYLANVGNKSGLVSKHMLMGEKHLSKLILETGQVLSCSPDHKVYVYDKGKYKKIKLKELKIGDNVCVGIGGRFPESLSLSTCVPDKKKEILYPKKMTDDLAYILATAYLSSDWNKNIIEYIHVTKSKKEHKKYVDTFVKTFNIQPVTYFVTLSRKYYAVCARKDLTSFFLSLGVKFLQQHKTELMEIPWSILKSPESSAVVYLKNLLGEDLGDFSFESKSEKLISQCQQLLLRLGYLTRIYKSKNVIFNYNKYVLRSEKVGIKYKYKKTSRNDIVTSAVEHCHIYMEKVRMYDMTVELEEHAYQASGMLVSNSVDEIGFFDNEAESRKIKVSARGVYEALDASLLTVRGAAEARIKEGMNDVVNGIFANVSSPSSQRDKIMELVKQSQNSETLLGIHKATWEVNPSLPKNSKVIKEAYRKDPELAERNYGANPPLSASPFITDTEMVVDSFGIHKNSITLTHKVRKENGIRKACKYAIAKVKKSKIPEILAIDAGYTKNSFALALASFDQKTQLIKYKALVEVAPKAGFPLNYTLIFENVIIPIFENRNIKMFLADRWNSLKLLSDIGEAFECEVNQYSLKYQDIFDTKILLEQRAVVFPKLSNNLDEVIAASSTNYPFCYRDKESDHLALQMLTVQDSGTKILKGEGLTDDIWRAVCLSNWAIQQDSVKDMLIPTQEEQQINHAIAFSKLRKNNQISSVGNATGGQTFDTIGIMKSRQ